MTKLNTMLAIDSSEPALLEQKRELENVGILVFRVDTMQDAITLLEHGEEYLCVVINEDSIPDFMRLLPVLCDIARTQVYIITHTYTKTKHMEAMEHGADAYVTFGVTAREDALCAVEHLKLAEKWTHRQVNKIPVLACGDIVISQSRRNVFVKEKELFLTRKEFDILYYLMENRGILLTYEQILITLWGVDYDKCASQVVWPHIKRIRKKLEKVSPCYENVIENTHGLGYKFAL